MKKLYLIAFIILFCIGYSPSSIAQSYNFDGIASGATGTFSNGWSCNTTVGYSWQALSGMTTSGGTGPSGDHTSGTGIYLYTEASTPAAIGDSTFLESPSVMLTGFNNPGVSFWFHMAGSGMGNMYIDVYHNSSWVMNVDSLIGATQSVETDPWIKKTIDLTAYNGSTVQLRFRSYYGTSWSGDMAIDDVEFIELPPYEAELVNLSPDIGYFAFPLSQLQPINFSGDIKNNGADTITDVKLYQFDGTSLDSGSVAQLLPNQQANISINNSYAPMVVDTYDLSFYVGLNENDTFNINDSASYQVAVNDSVYARENDNITLGIGFTGATGIFGQMFNIVNQDTLTGLDLKLVAPTLNDQLKIKIYHFSNGAPGAIIDSSAAFTIPSALDAWYSLHFPCDLILAPGEYFVAVEQLSTNNLSFGYTNEFYEPNVTFFNSGAGWTSFESVGFEVSLGLRMIFGNPFVPILELGNDTAICYGEVLMLDAGPGYSTYDWSNNTSNQSVTLGANGTFYVTAETSSGCVVSDTISLLIYPEVTSSLTDQTTCYGADATFDAGSNSNYTYDWSTGQSANTITASALGTYLVTITDTTGCSIIDSADILAGFIPTVTISLDSINFCDGDTGMLVSTQENDVSYLWTNGDSGIIATVTTGGYYYVTGTSTISGCAATDSAVVNIWSLPAVDLGNDTSICDTSSLLIELSGFTSYNWSNGFISNKITITDAGTYTVTVTDINACVGTDSIEVTIDTCTVIIDNIVDLNQNDFTFDLYPNPADHTIFIKTELIKKTTFKVININGQTILVDQLEIGTSHQMNVSDIPPGIYFMEISSDGLRAIRKMVIQ